MTMAIVHMRAVLGHYRFGRMWWRPRLRAVWFAYFVLISAVVVFVLSYPIHVASTMKLLHVIHRHGDRSVYRGTPNDPYVNTSYWPSGLGQLTNAGKLRMYELGQYIRKRYANFLQKKYFYKYVYARSTDMERTLMSAESLLAGLYPPEGYQVWNHDVKWQPIPVHSVPTDSDYLLFQEYPCSRYEEELKQVMSSLEMERIQREYSWLYDFLTEMSGANITEPLGVHDLYDDLTVERDNNLTLPKWSERVYPEKMRLPMQYSFTMRYYTQQMRRIKAGPLLNEIIQHLSDFSANRLDPPERQLFLYSAHDTNIASFLSLLGVFDPHQPPFGATVLVELHQGAFGGHFVKLLYYNETKREPYVLTMPGCIETCPLNKFIQLTQPLLVVDFTKEC